VRFTFEIAGDKLVEREILRVGLHAKDARPAFEAIADYMMAETREQFASEGRHASGGWKPLKAATLRAKARKGLDPRILHASGALDRSLTSRGDPAQLLQIRPQELVFGSRLVYAAAHQRPKPGSRLPQRRPLQFTEQAKRQILKILQRWLVAGEVA
jgi:phage gpG-like protein